MPRLLPLAAFAALASINAALAQTWTAAATGNWNNPSNWSSNPTVPTSSPATVLTFPARGATYTATNNLGNPFVLNGITFDSQIATNTTANFLTVANADGFRLQFQGAGAFVATADSGDARISGTSTTLATDLAVTGAGSGTLRFDTQLTGPGRLTIDRPNTVAGSTAVVLAQPAGIAPNDFAGGVLLQSGALRVEAAAALGSGPLTVTATGVGYDATGSLSNGTGPITLPNAVGVAAGATFNIFAVNPLGIGGSITGAGAVNIGNRFSFSGAAFEAANAYAGPTTVQRGSLTLRQAGTLDASAGLTLAVNSLLTLDNTAAHVPTRITGATNVTADWATFTLTANATAGNDAVQSLGTVNGRGQVTFQLNPTASTAARWSVANFNRLDRATLKFDVINNSQPVFGGPPGPRVGTVTFGTLDGVAPQSLLVGAGTSPMTQRILPFAVANTPQTFGLGFVTYDANGFRSLNSTSEYMPTFPDPSYPNSAAFNVRLQEGASAVTRVTTVNSLIIARADAGVWGLDGATGGVTVTSGAVMASITPGTIHLSLGSLNFGAAEGIIHSQSTLLVNSLVTGSNGLTVAAQPGVVRLLNPANSFAGPVTINGGGVLSFEQNAALGAAGNAVTLSGGALRFTGFDEVMPRAIRVTAAGGGVQVSTGPGSALTLTGAITGSGGLYLNELTGGNFAQGEMRLQGDASGYSGTPILNGVIRLDSDARLGTSGRAIVLGATLYPTASFSTARTFEVAGALDVRSDAGVQLTFAGPLRAGGGGDGGSGLTKTGGGSLRIENVASHSGPTNVGDVGGFARVLGGDLVLAAGGSLPRTSGISIAQSGRLTLDNAGANLGNRVNDAPVTLAGGTLRLTGNATAPSAETFNTLNLRTDTGSAIDLAPGGSQTAAVTFTAGGSSNPLTRANGSTLVVSGTGLGTRSLVRFASPVPPTLASNVLPGVFGLDGGVPTLVTAPQAGGVATVRPLTAAELTASFASSGAGDNVRPTGPEAVGTQTVNAAHLTGSATVTVSGTLTLASGNLIVSPGATVAGPGTVAGPAEGLNVFAAGTAADTIPLSAGVGGSRLNKAGPAALELQGANAATIYNVHAGTLRLGAAGTIPATSTVQVQSGATLDLNGRSTTVQFLNGLGTVQLGTDPATVLTVAPSTFSSSLWGTVTGAGSVVKSGTGRLLVSGEALASVPVTVAQGTLVFGNENSLSPIVVPLVAGPAVTLADGATLAANAVRDFARDIVVGVGPAAGTAMFTHNFGMFEATVTTVSGNIAIGANKTLVLNASGEGVGRMTGTISGPGQLTISGGGKLTISGTNAHAGGTTVSASGTLAVGSDAAFGTGPVALAPLGQLTLMAAGGDRTLTNPLSLGNFTTAGPGRLTFAGDATVPNGATITVLNAGGVVLTNVTGGGVNSSMIKAGGGTLVLRGTTNLGGLNGIDVTAGTLLVPAGASIAGSGRVTVGAGFSQGAPAILAGGGSLAGQVFVQQNGTVSPGESAGELMTGNGLSFFTGSAYRWELAANTTAGPGTNWDRIRLTGGQLEVVASAQFVPSFIDAATAPSAADPFWQQPHVWENVIDLTGTASNPSGGVTFVIDNTPWLTAGAFSTQAAVAGTGVRLVWTPVPEPAHLLALASLALGTAQVWRGRRPSRRSVGH